MWYSNKKLIMKKITLYTGVLVLFVATGCKKFVDVNQDPNNQTSVQEKILLATIEVNIANGVAAGGEGTAATYTNHFMQMICYNQVALNYGTYYFVNTNINSSWGTVYTTCLENLKILRQQSTANGNSNYTAISEILTAYTLAFATDLWGDIPWSKSLGGSSNLTPTYDSQASIYDTAQALLDKAVTDIDKKTGLKVGADDYYYSGDMTKWRKLAYSLKARYYMHLTKAPGHNAATQAGLALTALQNGMTGIAAHMNKLGVASSDTTTSLAARGTLTAGNSLELIMQEKKIADFLSPENFVDWRRTGFPRLTIVPNAQAPAIPRRLIYPQSEINANSQPQQSAALVDRVWWDQP